MLTTILKKGNSKNGFWYVADIQSEFMSYYLIVNSKLDLEVGKKYEDLRLRISTYKGQTRYELVN